MGYFDAEVAPFLGINTSAVNRLTVSNELPEIRFGTNGPFFVPFLGFIAVFE